MSLAAAGWGVARLQARVRPGDLVLTLGAGSVSSLSDRLLAKLREAAE